MNKFLTFINSSVHHYHHKTTSHSVSVRSVSTLLPISAYVFQVISSHKALRLSSLGSSINTVVRLRAGRQRFDSWQSQGFFFLVTASGPVLGPTEPPIEWVRGTFCSGVRQPGRGSNHTPQCNAEINNV